MLGKLLFVLILLFALGFTALGLTSCSTMKASDFRDKTPVLVPEEFFIGNFIGHGVFYDRSGRIRRQFSLTLSGSNQDGKLILDELLRYDDGEELTRKYEIEKTGPNSYEARSEDLVKPASIEAFGNTLRWSYTLRQLIGETVWELNFDDWMFRVSEDTILNRAYVKKFGLEVGQVIMSLRKLEGEEKVLLARDLGSEG